MAAIGVMVGGAVVNALAFTGGNCLFSLLGDKSAEAEKNESGTIWLLRSSSVHRPNTSTNASCVLTTSTNSFRLSNIVHRFLKMLMWQCENTGSSLEAMKRNKSCPRRWKGDRTLRLLLTFRDPKQYELAFIVGGLALTGWAAFRFL